MAPNGKRSARSTKPRKMECGKHYRPSNILEEPRNTYDYMPRPDQRYRRKLLPGDTRGSCICDYYDFPHLREERLYLDSEYKTQKKTYPFLKLPAEIRNQIYDEIFVVEEAIEFCPEPFFFNGYKSKHREEGDWHDDFDRITVYHSDWKKDNVGCYVPFLRVNKQICAEATPVLYGENEFRFSNMTGWVALDFFLFEIGLEKSSMLRKIAVSHPDTLFLPSSRSKLGAFMQGSPFFRLFETKEPGFVYENRWFENPISKDPALILQKCGKLQQLHLICPASTHHFVPKSPVDLTCFENLDFALVSLRTDKHLIRELPIRYKAANAAEMMAEEHFQETGEKWNFFDKAIDENGRY